MAKNFQYETETTNHHDIGLFIENGFQRFASKTFLLKSNKNIFSNNEPLILDLSHQKDYAPIIKTNGIVLPGYKAGWFRLTNKQKALVFVTDKSKVVYLSTNEGYSILLSVTKPKEFIDTLQNFWKDQNSREYQQK